MATHAINLPQDAGAFLRQLGRRISDLSRDIPDQAPTGGTHTLTIDDNPGQGTVSVQITAGPYQSNRKERQ